jgi:ABC-2 type transport system ATP-binding protein
MITGIASAVEMKGVTKLYGNFRALDGLSLEIQEGEIFGLLGPNGAGKTTTIKILITLLQPTEGEVKVLGRDAVRQAREVRQRIGYVPQERALDRFLTGREHLELLANLYHLPASSAVQQMDRLLALVDLKDKADELVSNYSGGMKRKLDIACGLIPNPKLLFLDEPTLGLDVQSRIRIWEYVRRLKAQGMTIVMSTNYLDEADQLCDRIAIVYKGQIKAVGSPAQLKQALGGDRLLLRLSPDRPDRIEALAKSLEALDTIRRVSRQDHTLELRVAASDSLLPAVLKQVVDSGCHLETVQYSRPSLEDVFVTHTGHGIQEGPAPEESLEESAHE